jgi:hypothetical protein
MENNNQSLNKIKEITCDYCKAIPYKVLPYGIVSHPIIDTTIDFNPECPEKSIIITQDNKDEIIEQRLNRLIRNADCVNKIFVFINKPYRLPLLMIIQNLLEQKELSELMRWIWTSTEFPHQNRRRELVELFKKVDKKILMTKREQEKMDTLPETIKVYRGVWGKKITRKGLSWTLNKDTAKWFSKRFAQKGRVFEANISKEHIFLYTNDRNEEEIVLNPYELKNLKETT